MGMVMDPKLMSDRSLGRQLLDALPADTREGLTRHATRMTEEAASRLMNLDGDPVGELVKEAGTAKEIAEELERYADAGAAPPTTCRRAAERLRLLSSVRPDIEKPSFPVNLDEWEIADDPPKEGSGWWMLTECMFLRRRK